MRNIVLSIKRIFAVSGIMMICACLSGCSGFDLEEELDLDDVRIRPQEDKRYQIISSISPEEDQQFVYVQRVSDVSNQEARRIPIEHAVVKVRQHGTGNVYEFGYSTTLSEERTAVYQTGRPDFVVLPDEDYTLTVEINGELFSGVTHVPKNQLREFTLERIYYQVGTDVDGPGGIDYAWVFDISFKDVDEEQANYYTVTGVACVNSSELRQEYKQELDGSTDHDTFNTINKRNTFTALYQLFAGPRGEDRDIIERVDSVTFYTLTTDENLFRYTRLVGFVEEEGGEGVAEPIILHSNIDNVDGHEADIRAHGIFGSYRRKSFPFTAEEVENKRVE